MAAILREQRSKKVKEKRVLSGEKAKQKEDLVIPMTKTVQAKKKEEEEIVKKPTKPSLNFIHDFRAGDVLRCP